MSVEQHTLSGKPKEVNTFLAALLNFTSCSGAVSDSRSAGLA
jgi:hypothetical protein